MALTYFAGDGSYGDASGLVIIDTRAWNNDQWQAVEESHDYSRAALAAMIALEGGDI